jgi:hypothetical protein
MNPCNQYERAKNRRGRDDRVKPSTPEREPIDLRERFRRLRVMLGEVSGSDSESRSDPSDRGT